MKKILSKLVKINPGSNLAVTYYVHRVVPHGSLDFQQPLQSQPPIPNSASSSGASFFKKVEQETCATEGCSSSENDARRWNWFSFESFRPYFSKLSASTCNLLTLSNIFVEQVTCLSSSVSQNKVNYSHILVNRL